MGAIEQEEEAAVEEDAGAELGADETDESEPGDDVDAQVGDEQLRQTAQAQRAETELDIERAMQSLGKEAARHAKRVGEIMGEDAAQLVPCELCTPAIPGFRFPVVPDEDVRERVKRAIGMSDLSRYRDSVDAAKCSTCDGLGQVRSGSEVVGQQTLQCLSCKGKGWTSASPERQAAAPVVVGAPPIVDHDTPPEPLPDLDPWGTPPDDPEYGKMPQFRTAEGRDRIAARLAAAG